MKQSLCSLFVFNKVSNLGYNLSCRDLSRRTPDVSQQRHPQGKVLVRPSRGVDTHSGHGNSQAASRPCQRASRDDGRRCRRRSRS